jgi:hypothetical protein
MKTASRQTSTIEVCIQAGHHHAHNETQDHTLRGFRHPYFSMLNVSNLSALFYPFSHKHAVQAPGPCLMPPPHTSPAQL